MQAVVFPSALLDEDGIERAGPELFTAQPALDLSAGRSREIAGLEQGDREDLHLMMLGNRPADRCNDFARICLDIERIKLMDYHQSLFAFDVHREGRSAVGAQRRMRLDGGEFDILRVVLIPLDQQHDAGVPDA